MINDKTRSDMFQLLGMIEAIRFPLVWSNNETTSQAYYDLIDSIRDQYIKILKETVGYSDE
jgi:hypothetical protein